MTENANVFSALGINPLYLLGQIVNFGLLLFVLNKFIYKPLLKKLDERAKLVSSGVKAAENNIKRQEEIENERKARLAQTQKEVEKIIIKAKDDALSMQNEIVSKAKEDAEKFMVKQKQEYQQFAREQEKELQGKVVDISAQIARKVMTEFIDDQTQGKILETQLKKLASKKV